MQITSSHWVLGCLLSTACLSTDAVGRRPAFCCHPPSPVEAWVQTSVRMQRGLEYRSYRVWGKAKHQASLPCAGSKWHMSWMTQWEHLTHPCTKHVPAQRLQFLRGSPVCMEWNRVLVGEEIDFLIPSWVPTPFILSIGPGNYVAGNICDLCCLIFVM